MSKIIFPNDNRLDPAQKRLILLVAILAMVALVIATANSASKDGYKVRQQQEQEAVLKREKEALELIQTCVDMRYRVDDCVHQFDYHVVTEQGKQALDLYVDYRRAIERGQKWRP